MGSPVARHLLAAVAAAAAALAAAMPAAGQDSLASGSGELGPAEEASSEEATTESPGTPKRSSGDGRAAQAEEEPLVESAGGRSSRRRLGDRTLEMGMRGTDVRQLQRVLTALNFRTEVDGRFGKSTKRGVKRYERWRQERVNGSVSERQGLRMKRQARRGVRYSKHVFPVRGPYNYGGDGSRFGAPRSGHTHQGQDVAAAEGTPLVAVHEGRVTTRQYQAGGAGHYLVIRGRDGSDSVYMHLQAQAVVAPGDRVMAGHPIGRVGTTGYSTGPHLHFELWTPHWYAGGQPYDPLPKLLRWEGT